MKDIEAIFEFRCKRCHFVFDGPHTAIPNALPTLVELIQQSSNSISKIGGIISKVCLHHCEDGLGVADLIGCRFINNN
jgi:hypothetical protein